MSSIKDRLDKYLEENYVYFPSGRNNITAAQEAIYFLCDEIDRLEKHIAALQLELRGE